MSSTLGMDERDRAIEFYERALVGTRIAEREFDSRLLPAKLKELASKYDIRMRPEEVMPSDLDMAARLFEAGLELLADVGVYCVDAGRTVRTSRDEVLSGLGQMPESVSQGSGSQAVEIESRRLEDSRPAATLCGFTGATVAEEIYVPSLATYAREDIDGLILGAVASVAGVENRAVTPAEIMACKKEGVWGRRAVASVGKPGMPLIGVMSGSTSESQLAAIFPDGLWLDDALVITMPSNLKLEYQHLNKVLGIRYLGARVHGHATITLGMYGGAESTAICAMAALLYACAVGIDWLTWSVISIFTGVATGRESLWCQGMIALAFQVTGHSPGCGGAWCLTAGGPGTEMAVNESVAFYVTMSACGCSCLLGGIGNKGAFTDQVTGMNARLQVRIAGAAAGLDLREAGVIVSRANASYEKRLIAGDVPTGKSFSECYDLDSLEPTSESMAFAERQREWLQGLGLSVQDA